MTKGLAPLTDRCWVPFRPTADVPAYAVMEATGTTVVNGTVVITTRQYTSSSTTDLLLINGPVAVTSGQVGVGTTAEGYPMAMLATGSPNTSDSLGPYSGSWSGATNGTAYEVWGDGPVSGTAMVSRVRVSTTVPAQCFLSTMRHSGGGSNTTVSSGDAGTWSLGTTLGDLTGASITKLTASSYNDPCIRLDQAGFWRVHLAAHCTVGTAPTSPASTSTETTGLDNTTSSHTHEYEQFAEPHAGGVRTQVYMDDGGDDVYSITGLADAILYQWDDNGWVVRKTATNEWYVNVDANTQVKIFTTYQHFSGSTMNAELFAVTQTGSSVILERISDRTDT